jgi:hypothetical protein
LSIISKKDAVSEKIAKKAKENLEKQEREEEG